MRTVADNLNTTFHLAFLSALQENKHNVQKSLFCVFVFATEVKRTAKYMQY